MTEIVRLGGKVSSGYFPEFTRSAFVLIYRIIAQYVIVDHVSICFRILAASNLGKGISSPLGSEFNCTRRIQYDSLYYNLWQIVRIRGSSSLDDGIVVVGAHQDR